MATQQEVIKKFMASLDKTTLSGTKAFDEAVKACSNFDSATALIAQMFKDREKSSDAESFLKTYCGIDLSNTDTGAITGKDAGGSTTKTATSIIPETDSKKYPSGTTFTKQGLTVIIPEKIVDDSIGTKADKEFMISGLYSWWIEEGLKLIKESYGYSFSDNDAATQKVTVKFTNSSATGWHAWIDYTNINDMSLNINMYYFHDVDTSNFNGKGTYNNNLLDRTIAHELTHAIMAAKVNNYSTLPLFLREGLAELVHGIDDEKPNAIKQLIEIDYLDGDGDDFADFLNLTANKSGYGYEYAAGYILLRYLAKQAANSTIADAVNTIDNRRSNVSVIGGSGRDSVYNSGSYATISVGAGDDTVRNFGANAAVYGGAGNDSLYNDDDAVRSTINTGDGNNYVSNFGSNTKIIGGSGKDSIYNDDDCSSITITSSAGNDTVRNLSNSTSIDLGADNDSVSNSGSFVTIKGGVGDDYIFNTGSNLLINYASGDGNDKIIGFNATSTLSISGSSYSTATSGNDLILTVGSNKITLSSAATLSAPKIISDTGNKPTAGNDSISNSSKGVTINLLGGNDTLRNYGASVTVNAGAGDDDVYNYSVSSGSSINCGTGADYVLNFADKVKILGGKGNDSIRNLNSGYLDGKNITSGNVANSVTISGGAGDDSITNSGNKVSIAGDADNDYIRNEGTNVTIYGGSGEDSIYNYNSKTKIFGGDDDDYISNASLAASVTIAGGNGNDSIFNTFNAGTHLSISGDAGKDYIYNWGDHNTLKGGTDNDTIYSSANNVAIFGGKGNDSLQNYNGKNVLFNYSSGDGNDSIVGFNSTSTLSISDVSFSTKASGSDLLVKVGKGSVLLKDAKKLSDNIVLSATNSANSSLTLSSTVKNIDASSRTKAIQITGNSKANTITGGSGNDKLYGQAGDDTLRGGKGKDSLWGGAGNDILYGGSGKDTFIYKSGEGTDKIFDYESGDMLKILKSNGAAGGKFTKSKYSDGTLSLTISGGGKVIFEDVSTSTKFNINGTSYKISGSKLK